MASSRSCSLLPNGFFAGCSIASAAARQPEDDDPFDVGDIGPFCDGDWPAWPEQKMLRWLPKDIQIEFGTVVDSVHNGEFLVLDAARENEIVAALRQRGHRCTKDDDLVRRACGK